MSIQPKSNSSAIWQLITAILLTILCAKYFPSGLLALTGLGLIIFSFTALSNANKTSPENRLNTPSVVIFGFFMTCSALAYKTENVSSALHEEARIALWYVLPLVAAGWIWFKQKQKPPIISWIAIAAALILGLGIYFDYCYAFLVLFITTTLGWKLVVRFLNSEHTVDDTFLIFMVGVGIIFMAAGGPSIIDERVRADNKDQHLSAAPVESNSNLRTVNAGAVSTFKSRSLASWDVQSQDTTNSDTEILDFSSQPYFSIESTKEEVFQAMSNPTSSHKNTWFYDFSRVTFDHGRVSEVLNDRRGRFLNVRIYSQPNFHPMNKSLFFEPGSTANQVQTVLGKPKNTTKTSWFYKSCVINFAGGHVVGAKTNVE